MPKIVDHEQRRAEIIAALMRVVSRGGFAAASVRNVAAEAGLSAGSLRHYFASQQELAEAAALAVIAGITDRVNARIPQARTMEDWVHVLEQIMPVDPDRLVEFEVWLDLVNEGRTDPALGAISAESYAAIQQLCEGVLGELGVTSTPQDDAATALHGLLDGLSLHLVLYPDVTTPEQARSVLRAHLRSLLGSDDPRESDEPREPRESAGV